MMMTPPWMAAVVLLTAAPVAAVFGWVTVHNLNLKALR